MGKYIVPIIVGVVVMAVVIGGLGALFGAAGERPPGTVWYVGIFLGLFTAYIMANLAGTRNTAKASDAERQAALAFAPPPGKGAIYLYREGFMGMAAGLNVSVDDKVVAQLKAPRFTCVTVAPGKHAIDAAFTGLAGPQNKAGEMDVEVPDGGCVAVRITLSMGAIRNTIRLEQQPVEQARSKLPSIAMTKPDLAEV